MMRLTSKRVFKCEGKKYFVQNTPEADKEGRKDRNYSLFVWDVKKDWWNLCISKLGFEDLYFRTIKDAQRFVRDSGYLLTTWEESILK